MAAASQALIPASSLLLAIRAILKHTKSQPKHQKAQLFEADDFLYLIVTLTRIPSKSRTNPYRIPIPHPLHDPQSTSICLLLDDRPSSPLPPSAALDLLQSRNPFSNYRVIGLSDLKSDYKPFESRRKLLDSYDLFFADKKILPLLPRLLGNGFFRKKKIPLGVDFGRKGWVEQIEGWMGSSLLYLRSGTCCGVRIGRVGMGEEEVVENAEKVVEGVGRLMKWGGVRSVHVKTVESVALPVYQKVPEVGMRIESVGDGGEVVEVKKKKGTKRGREEERRKKGKKGRVLELCAGDASVGGEMENGGEKFVEIEKNEGGIVVLDANVEEVKKEKKEKKKKKGGRDGSSDLDKKRRKILEHELGGEFGIKEKIKLKRSGEKDGKKKILTRSSRQI